MNARSARPSVDTRTRPVGTLPAVDAAAFWNGEWLDALSRNGERHAAADAARLDLPPLAIAVDGEVWTLRRGERTLDGGGRARAARPARSRSTADAFTDLVHERRTALGLVIGARVSGDPDSNETFSAWDPVLRSALDGRGVYRPGDVVIRAPADGAPLDLDQRFRLGEGAAEDTSVLAEAGHFLAEAGFLLLQGVFTDAEMDAVDADLDHAVPPPARRRRVVVGGDERRRSLPVPHPRLRPPVAGAPRAARRSPLSRDRRAARRRSPSG